MKKEIRLVLPDKEKFFRTINNLTKITWYEQIEWLVESDIDIEFYRMDGNKKITYSKEDMRITLEQNWECRGKEQEERTDDDI